MGAGEQKLEDCSPSPAGQKYKMISEEILKAKRLGHVSSSRVLVVRGSEFKSQYCQNNFKFLLKV
jgi:hypothetical protein